MSDYEKINAKVKVQMATRRKEAFAKIIGVLLTVMAVLGAIVVLKVIGFISVTFAVILAAITICTGAFNAGYIWRDVKW